MDRQDSRGLDLTRSLASFDEADSGAPTVRAPSSADGPRPVRPWADTLPDLGAAPSPRAYSVAPPRAQGPFSIAPPTLRSPLPRRAG